MSLRWPLGPYLPTASDGRSKQRPYSVIVRRGAACCARLLPLSAPCRGAIYCAHQSIAPVSPLRPSGGEVFPSRSADLVRALVYVPGAGGGLASAHWPRAWLKVASTNALPSAR